MKKIRQEQHIQYTFEYYMYIWTKTTQTHKQLMTSILERENGSNAWNNKHTQANGLDKTSKGSNEFVFFL